MKIAINASRAINEKAGVGRVADNLIKNLLMLDKQNEYQLFFNYFRHRQEKYQQAKQFKQKNSQINISHWPGQIQEWWFGLNIQKNIAADVYLSPTFLDFNFGLKAPQIVIIHDLTMYTHPDHAGQKISKRYQDLTRRACRQAAKIIAVSEATKQDIIKILKISADKIKVVYPGNTKFSLGGKLPVGVKSKSYILFVGTIEPRKNLQSLLSAYQLLPIIVRKKYPLVIAGGKGWNNRVELQKIGQTEGVKWLGYISDADLGELYRQAAVFAYPSLYEGFGLPVIEAQQFGVPILTSNTSSLPEACGAGGILVDPQNPKDIADGLSRILSDKNLAQTLGKKARAHAANFSWQKSAKEVLEVLKSVM